MIIKMARPGDYQKGDIIYIADEPHGESGMSIGSGMGMAGGPFKYSLGASFAFSSISSETDGGGSSDVSQMELQARFGIVKDKMEFGGIFEYSSWDFGGAEISSMVLGGFGEFNLGGDGKFVPAAGGYLAYVSSEAGSSKTSGFRLQPYGRGKFFAATDIAVVGELGFRYEMLSADGGGDVTNSGFILSAGLIWYIR